MQDPVHGPQERVIVTVPVSLPLARELVRVARGRVSPELAALHAQIAEAIIAEHDELQRPGQRAA